MMKAIRLLPLASLAMLLVATLQAAEHTVEVKAETVNLYIEPDTTSKVFATASKGTVLAIQETTRDWYRVSAPGSGYGVWVRKVDLEAAPTASKPAAVPSTLLAMPQPQPNQLGSSASVMGRLSIEHQGVGCVVAGKFPEFDAKLDPADQVSRAQIDFHAEDDPRWYFVAMKLENGVYRGILPQPLKETKRIHYYIEATGSDLTTSRTQEYTPDVVEGSGVCVGRKTVAAVVASASVVVQTVVPGAPVIPAGFSAAGIATTASSTASTAAGTSTAASGGGGGSGLGAALGGVAVLGGLAATAAATQNNSAPTLTGVWDFSSSDGAGVFDLTQAGPNITGQIVSDWECSGFAQLPCPYACTGAINGPNVRLDCINHSGVIYLRPCSTGTHVLAGQIISMLANSALNHMTGTEAGRCDPGTVPATMTKRP